MGFGTAARLALRGLKRDAATSLSAVGILALGLAAPATFFSLLWGGGLRPLPVPEGDRVVRIDVRQPAGAGRVLAADAEDLEALASAGSLEALGAFVTTGYSLSVDGTGALSVSGADMTAGAFRLLRESPALGRFPDATEAPHSLVIGHDVWMELFEGSPDAIGAAVRVDGADRVVTAVMPEGFGFPFKQLAWTVASPGELSGAVELVGRLADGADPETAQLELGALWSRRDVVRPAESSGGVVRVQGFTHGRGEGGEAYIFGGLVLVGLCLLLIACVNAANLLLVRAADRVQMLGVQTALGAPRVQIAGQLFLEALALAAIGGVVGLWLASLMVDYVQTTMGPQNFGYYWMKVAVDGPVVVFTGILVFGTAILSGMLPVARVMRVDVQAVLKGDRAHGAFSSFGGWSRWLVMGQLALSCGALAAAGLTGQAMRTAATFGGELPSDQILMAGYELGTPEEGGARLAVDDLIEVVERLPGAVHGAVAYGLPGFREGGGPFEVEGVTYERPEDRPRALTNAVSADYFAALDLSLLRGRLMGPGDGPSAPPVVVVNESFARSFGASGEVLGTRVRVPSMTEEFATIVGVVSDADLGAGPGVWTEAVYFSARQLELPQGWLVLRADDPTALTPALRRAVAERDPEFALAGVMTLREGHRFMTQAQSTLSSLAVAGGGAGLLVAAVGLFGLLSFRVRQRMRILGVRMALGANGRRIGLDVMGFAFRQLLPAVGVGLTVAWILAPAFGPLLLGGDPRSPVTFGGVAFVFLATGLVASLVPALRAASVDPVEALRSD